MLLLPSQCGDLRIFLPFRFYVKPLLGNPEIPKIAILTIFEVLKLDFGDFFLQPMRVEFSRKQKSEPLQLQKRPFLPKVFKNDFT